MRRVQELLVKVSGSEAPVLITGETGTGKEVVARAIHRLGARRDGPFVVVDCGAIPHALLESELFGHARGAFTDARVERRGLFLEADGGTLLLDEIGELPLELQPKLLRALQEQRLRPVGSNTELPFDVRVVAATNRDLEALVDEGRFRSDLYYRLNVLPILLPPLRERPDDVALLARAFVREVAARLGRPAPELDADTVSRLRAYSWPGNVRELHSVIERALVLHPRQGLAALDLAPEPVHADAPEPAAAASPGDDLNLRTSLNRLERSLIVEAQRRSRGVRREAARLLGVDARNLGYYFRKHGLDPDADGGG
jgi:two-component system response regulator HydG